MQLVAYGAQDIYLTGNPQITFFKVVYRRHTNFSMESIKQTIDGTADFGSRISTTISRNGDLLYRVYLEHDIIIHNTEHTNDQNIHIGCDYGSNLMKEYELEIGGQLIDKHYGHWHTNYSQLVEMPKSGYHESLYSNMVGNGMSLSTALDTQSGNHLNPKYPGFELYNPESTGKTAAARLFIPFFFWFCKNPGLALPLIALQYHEVKLNITFENFENLVLIHTDSTNDVDALEPKITDTDLDAFLSEVSKPTSNDINKLTNEIWAEYIFLDTDERRRFAQVSHEYLIEQLQYTKLDAQKTNEFNFNHPIKELIWSTPRITDFTDMYNNFPPQLHDDARTANTGTHSHVSGTEGKAANQGQRIVPLNALINATPYLFAKKNISGSNTNHKFKIKLNGHDRFKARPAEYFSRVQVWEHHSGFGGLNVRDSIGVYSFALKPEEHQPSGTCNFSRIDTAEFVQEYESGSPIGYNLYAINYNILRIMSGMGGLAYSN